MDALNAAGQRLDRWLCNSRFFKTRGQAVAAIECGQIELNGARAKAARHVRAGDMLRIRRPPEVFEIEVRETSERRLSAKLAQGLYSETAASIAAREAQRAARAAGEVDFHGAKPSGKERRERELFKRAYE